MSHSASEAACSRTSNGPIINSKQVANSKCFNITDHSFRLNRSQTIIKDGIVEKWTNYVGAWRPRYFIVEPGILKYANAPGQPIKETFPLILCSTHSNPTDPLCLEVEHPHGVLYLRLSNAEGKKAWIDALQSARNIFFQSSIYSNHHMYQKPREESMLGLERPIDFKIADGSDTVDQELNKQFDHFENNAPMMSLVKKCTIFRHTLQEFTNQIRNKQESLIKLSESAQERIAPDDLKYHLFRLNETIENLLLATTRHLYVTEHLTLEEHHRNKFLQKNIKWFARRYYKAKTTIHKIGLTLSKLSSSVLSARNTKTRQNDTFTLLDSFLQSIENAIRRVSDSDSCSEENNDCVSMSAFNDTNKLLDLGSSTESIKSIDDVYFDAEEFQSISLNEIFFNRMDQLDIERRRALPAKRTDIKANIWSILKDSIGKDLSRISLPVVFNEPTSFLQRLAEDFQYSELLKTAAKLTDSLKRLLYVTVFSISPYASAIDRTYKPFNPLLSETYEISHRGWNFISEQISHHPPISAYHTTAFEFASWGQLIVKTRFTGKSLELSLEGLAHIVLNLVNVKNGLVTASPENYTRDIKSSKIPSRADTFNINQTEHYTYQRARAIVKNIIFGGLTFELYGSVIITNHDTGQFSYVEYLRPNQSRGEPNVIRGAVFDEHGSPRYRIGGWWNREIWAESIIKNLKTSCQPAAALIDFNSEIYSFLNSLSFAESNQGANDISWYKFIKTPKFHSRDPKNVKIDWDNLASPSGARFVVWKPEPRLFNSFEYYNFSQMTMELNELTPDYDREKGANIPHTDSRYRPDQRHLENGEVELATLEKNRLENKQRVRLGKNNSAQIGRWFSKCIDPVSHQPVWIYNGQYWETKRLQTFDDVLNIF